MRAFATELNDKVVTEEEMRAMLASVDDFPKVVTLRNDVKLALGQKLALAQGLSRGQRVIAWSCKGEPSNHPVFIHMHYGQHYDSS